MRKNTNVIPEYDEKNEDLLDVSSYLAENYPNYESSEEFDFEDFSIEYTQYPISLNSDEIEVLRDGYMDNEHDLARIKKIEASLSLEYPVYIYEGEILAGVHRAIAYLNKGIEEIPVVLIENIE